MKTTRNADPNTNEELSDSDSISFKENAKKSKIYYETLELKEERTKLAFIEYQAAERETEKNIGYSVTEDTYRSTDTLADRKFVKKPNLCDQQICRYGDNIAMFIMKTI